MTREEKDGFLALMAKLGETCFLCKWIHEDLKLNKKFTDHPMDSNDHGLFPVEGKVRHLELERISVD